jgi:galactonate dehydratase
LAATTPNFVIQEMPLGIHYNSDSHDLFTYVRNRGLFEIADGMTGVPHGPGLGIDIDEQRVREAARDAPTWRNPAWRGPDGGLREW